VPKERRVHVTIAVLQETKDTLDFIKRPGQTYDGAIKDLMAWWKEGHRLLGETKVPVSVEVGKGS